jgi:trimethylamine--corrinoid protein Co-methyltransferase
MRPREVNDDTLALKAIEDVGPGGHFFGAEHTLQRYETAFYSPLVSDWQNFERWKEAGQQDTATRANKIWKQLLAEYEQPPLDPAIDDQLQDYVDRRKNGEPVE